MYLHPSFRSSFSFYVKVLYILALGFLEAQCNGAGDPFSFRVLCEAERKFQSRGEKLQENSFNFETA